MSYINPYLDYRSYPQGYNPYATGGGQMQGAPSKLPSFGAQGAFPPSTAGGVPPAGFQQQQFPQQQAPVSAIPGMLPLEESYIENIFRLNKGKLATVYATFENNTQWNAKVFKGIIEAAGRDHLILSDPQTGMRILLPMVYFDYATFDEELEYEYPFAGAPQLATYPPR
ncbi:spore coat protein GerQ [Bacillus sp. DNRA2]|uniref:spore coat protein GerQ n=1 Tax=Bacillus sp. DNRA2 TaxID=2723053 RepID=UPI002006EFBC|nr:spore coat protein GerQ [Bacillus sp. DNRA2]